MKSLADGLRRIGIRVSPENYPSVLYYPHDLGPLSEVAAPPRESTDGREPIDIYIHIPFCASRCAYCKFSTIIPEDDAGTTEYMSLLNEEIRLTRRRFGDKKVVNICFGGGTPSSIKAEFLAATLDRIAACFDLSALEEIDVEGNPESLTTSKLKSLSAMGVNRISLGVQSLDDGNLRAMGRGHDAATAVAAAEKIAAGGFRNFNLDFIYAFPGQDVNDARRCLSLVERLKPTSATFFHYSPPPAARDRATRMEDIFLAQEVILQEMTRLAYAHCGSMFVSGKHRGGYSMTGPTRTSFGPFLGLGLHAHGYMAGTFRENAHDYTEYSRMIKEGRLPMTRGRTLSDVEKAAGALIMGSCLPEGVSIAGLEAKHGVRLTPLWRERIEMLKDSGILGRSAALMFTGRGMFFRDYVAEKMGAEPVFE